MRYHTEEELHKMHEQLNAFWKWLKQQPIPENKCTDEVVKQWQDIVRSANELHKPETPLLNQLLVAGVGFLEIESKAGKANGS